MTSEGNSCGKETVQKHSVWLLFFILLITLFANKLALPISGNEENYLAFAKQFWNPDWVSGSFSLTDFPGTRLLFQVLVGCVLNYLEWDSALILFRVSSFILLALGLAYLLRGFGLNYAEAFIVFQLYVMSKQSMFGGEHIFLDFEPKTLAYAAVFPSLYFYFKNKYMLAVAFLTIAANLHFLVGGWVMFILSIQMLLEKRYSDWMRSFPVFVLGVIPLCLYLFDGYFSAAEAVTDVSTNWIYVYFRNPHHLGIFSSNEQFWNTSALGMGLSISVLVLSFWLHRSFEGMSKRVNRLVQIILVINLIFVVVAFCDAVLLDSSGGLFLKYYPFRSNALASFLVLILLVLFLRNRMPSTIYRKFIVVASLTVFLLGTVQCYNSFQRRKNAAFTDSYIEACEFIRNKTPLNSSFALVNLGVSDSQTLAFMRLTERENFAVFKFVPTEKVVVQQWYQRQIDLRHLSEEIQYAEVLKDKYGVDYVLTTMRYDTDLLELVYDTDKFLIYRIR